jgi:hypothetical protein
MVVGLGVECHALEIDVDGLGALQAAPTHGGCTTGYITVNYFSVGAE